MAIGKSRDSIPSTSARTKVKLQDYLEGFFGLINLWELLQVTYLLCRICQRPEWLLWLSRREPSAELPSSNENLFRLNGWKSYAKVPQTWMGLVRFALGITAATET